MYFPFLQRITNNKLYFNKAIIFQVNVILLTIKPLNVLVVQFNLQTLIAQEEASIYLLYLTLKQSVKYEHRSQALQSGM